MLKNKILRKVFAVSLAAVMLGGTGFTTVGQFIGTGGISVSAATATDLKYFSYSGTKISSYNGSATSIVIPAKNSSGEFFTTVGSYFFYSDKVTDVKFESGSKITEISAWAFNDCTSLKSITLPENLTTIGSCAFYGCTSLETITIPSTVTTIDSSAFYGCTSLKKVIIQENDKSTLEIKNYAFAECTLLSSINLTNRVKSIGSSAFSGCTNLKTVNIPGTVGEINSSVFAGCEKLNQVTINKGITSVGDGAFSGCSSLVEIKLPDSVDNIGYEAFADCTALERAVVPNKDTSLYWSFYDYNKNLVLYGVEGSDVSTYAQGHNLSFRPLLINKTIISPKDVVIVNNTVTITSSAEGGYGNVNNYTYKIDLKKDGGTPVNKCTWTKKSEKKTFSYKFTEKGSYQIIVTIKDEKGLEEAKTFPIKVADQDTPFTAKATLSSENVRLGQNVKVNISADGGDISKSYFYDAEFLKATDNNFTHGSKNYSSSKTSFSYTPEEAGDYVVKVRIVNGTKGSDGKVTGMLIEKYLNFTVYEELKNLSAVSVSGNTVTVKNNASGGEGKYTYNVYYKPESTTQWTSLYKNSDFQKTNEMKFTLSNAGVYNVCVKVKDGTGDTALIAKKYFSVTSELVNNSKISASSVKLGSTVKITASAKGGSGEYSYAVLYKQKAQTKWTTKQDFSVNNTISVKPAKATDYDICVKVKDTNGTIVKKYFTVNVTE